MGPSKKSDGMAKQTRFVQIILLKVPLQLIQHFLANLEVFGLVFLLVKREKTFSFGFFERECMCTMSRKSAVFTYTPAKEGFLYEDFFITQEAIF